jgi:hypothetical protein
MGADGDLVEEVEMDPHIAERRRWIMSEVQRKIIREHWFSYRLEREARSYWSIYPGVDRSSMYTVLQNYRKGKLDDPMNGQVNDPACENYDAARLRFQREFDHLFTMTVVLLKMYDLYGARMWMSHGLRVGPFQEYVRNVTSGIQSDS